MGKSEFGLPVSDGVVTLRQSLPEDNEVLVNGRDPLFRRFLGDGDPEPNPLACIVAEGVVVGWIDYDAPRAWLAEGEVNVGYSVFADYRRKRYATRALELLIRSLDGHATITTATLLIDPTNEGSIGVAHRAGFVRHDDVDGERFYKRSISDGVDRA